MPGEPEEDGDSAVVAAIRRNLGEAQQAWLERSSRRLHAVRAELEQDGQIKAAGAGRFLVSPPAAAPLPEVEQSAFDPANIVPGIGFSPDKMLQGRLFSCGDAQRYRLGVNHHLIPVNRARCPARGFHRDGLMRVDGNFGGALGYEPNSYGEWREQGEFREPPLRLGGAADYWSHREDDDDDYYSQPGAPFRLMSPEQRQALF